MHTVTFNRVVLTAHFTKKSVSDGGVKKDGKERRRGGRDRMIIVGKKEERKWIRESGRWKKHERREDRESVMKQTVNKR